MSSAPSEDVRVITTIGHVDHGKTTFVDYLLAANNIISPRMAGKIRYMDSREDEQERGITMESSAVSLRFRIAEKGQDNGSVQKTYVVNLIDTPGHVDFSGEVSSASRLCDGALLLVDVVEGVCTQTISVLRQAWVDRVKSILVLNKCDRLVTELRLTPVEAYHHLSRVVEQVNAVMGSFYAGERMEDDLRWREEREKRLAERRDNQADVTDAASGNVDNLYTADAEFQEKDDEDLYFAPERGNVVFASAIDGWGFRIGKFAQLYAVKLGIKEASLRKVLWGDFYLDPKTKRVVGHKHLKGRALKPLFVQFVLDNIWAVYDSVVLNPNPDKVKKIVTTLNLKIPPRELKSKDARHLLSIIFGQWLSLSTCTIQTVVDVIPAPSVAQATRMPKMLYPDLRQLTLEPKNKLERDLFSCISAKEACVVAYVSKMFAVSSKDLPENKRKPLTAEQMRQRWREMRQGKEGAEHTNVNGHAEGSPLADREASTATSNAPEGDQNVLLGFARLYSGALRTGSFLYCVLPKYTESLGPSHPRNANHVITAKVETLYTMMGRDLELVDTVKAGNVFAVKGLEGKVWRHATLCAPDAERQLAEIADEDRDCLLNLGGIIRQTSPIVRVALEPTEPADLPKLVEGLKLLNQADPAVETCQQETGEYVILTAGELHLERCLKDLRERFAKVDIQPSAPIVPFRETAVKAPEMIPPKNPSLPRGTVEGSSAYSVVRFRIQAVPLPREVLEYIQDNLLMLGEILRERKLKEQAAESSVDNNSSSQRGKEEEDDLAEGISVRGDIFRKPMVRPDEFWTGLEMVCKKAGGQWQSLADKVWAFGPQSVGGCVLVEAREGGQTNSLRSRLRRIHAGEAAVAKSRLLQDAESSVETGFQMATFRGPLCAEPVEGLAFFVENLQIDSESREHESPQVIGSLISAVQDACRSGILDWSPRLMLAMYTCDIQASTNVLGKVYGVVAKRRGRIVSEEMKEGSTFFTVRAFLPVVESFGFADEIRKRTSGAASPQLIFSGYEMLDLDPFWVPTTEEELEDLGEKADRENVAKVYMDQVRERKGLFVDRKIVEFAEKQRTLKR